MGKDDFFIKRIQELARQSYNREIVSFTDFLSLNELHMVNSLESGFSGVSVESSGGYEFAERQIAAFIPDALSYRWEYPICCIQISNKAARFQKALTHRDYLGALIHLGIERSTLGDILVKEDGAYVFCQEHIADFILENLNRVKNTSVCAALIDNPEHLPRLQTKEITGSVSSLRLDSVLAVAFHSSRSSLVQNIESGNVYVNGKQITSNGYQIKDGDLISLRGKGKCQFVTSSGQSRKGRIFITLNRYV